MHSEILDQLVVYSPKNQKIRYGSTVPSGDGGYVVVDCYEYDYYIGCGVGGNCSFEAGFLSSRPNINGLIFDGTIKYYPIFSNHVYFVPKNIADHNTSYLTNLNNECYIHNDIFLKMDIEGHEWNWIKSFQEFDGIKQMTIEVHGLFRDPKTFDWTTISNHSYQDILDGLKKINETHYLVHFHSNTSAEYALVDGKELPTVAELTYIRRRDCEIVGLNTTPLPIDGLDYRNGYERHDLSFASYPFCSKNG